MLGHRIAKNLNHFETWSDYQGCVQCDYTDIPEDIKQHADRVFDVAGRIPRGWADEESSSYEQFLHLAPPEGLRHFIKEAYKVAPDLFFDEVASLCDTLRQVHKAWERLTEMESNQRLLGEKYSEADYELNVYNIIRATAITHSRLQGQRRICLPQPMHEEGMSATERRILSTKVIVPDCCVSTSLPSNSASASFLARFRTLSRDRSIKNWGRGHERCKFRFQATPCDNIREPPSFEFISSVWEDKKPAHAMLDDAWRRNRMATASVCRHLHSLKVRAPVFGLVWADATVRVHVDWCVDTSEDTLRVCSAPYNPYASRNGNDSKRRIRRDKHRVQHDSKRRLYHDYCLTNPGDLLRLYFLIVNIDAWTLDGFLRLISAGLDELERDTTAYRGWRHVGEKGLRGTTQGRAEKTNAGQGTTKEGKTVVKRSRTSADNQRIHRSRNARESLDQEVIQISATTTETTALSVTPPRPNKNRRTGVEPKGRKRRKA
ncbi:hypothetical protein FISHEDRAFT_48595 [Fistulina hepatica ATCC 64428]|uniref:Uncharacterized protein n=1 Tax=Fistulina hepatica ATCC 64428 TaxID=1128425 RepID=A0A0D7A4L5_9AGAR|nr:hypothetical protein FISHEDRAFT_48595 [Fistulina hepatica ATCC 64428]